MTIKVLEGLTPDWFTPASELDAETPTRFKLKPLNGFEYMDVLGETAVNEHGHRMLNARGMRQAIKYGLVDWENFDAPFNQQSVGTIPTTYLIEIANEIINRSDLTGEKEKN